jgi:prepilin-type N-terminal cleavage/methylation domain-containing protein
MKTLRIGNRLPSWGSPQRPEAGLTLIECLVAIVVISISVAAVTPALVISVASRVQSQKSEQALALAQTEIDRIRTLMERGATSEISSGTALPIASGSSALDVAAPGSFVAANPTLLQARRVDLNGDGTSDFAVQAFRTPGISAAGEAVAFEMGVRVYSIEAEGNTLTKDAGRLGLTSGSGARSTQPLATLYTTIVRGDSPNALCNYYEQLGSTASAVTALDCN